MFRNLKRKKNNNNENRRERFQMLQLEIYDARTSLVKSCKKEFHVSCPTTLRKGNSFSF